MEKPVFSARGNLRFRTCRTRRTRRSIRQYASTLAAVSSRDPSSTTISSSRRWVCVRQLCSACSIYRAPLYVGSTMETRGTPVSVSIISGNPIKRHVGDFGTRPEYGKDERLPVRVLLRCLAPNPALKIGDVGHNDRPHVVATEEGLELAAISGNRCSSGQETRENPPPR